MNRMSHFIEIQPHEHRTETQAMISVEMADENPGHNRRRHISENKLPLSPFARIKQEPLIVPTNKISAVIPKAGGLLA